MKTTIILALLLFASTCIMAQDDPKPEKYKNVTWHRVVKIDYKAGEVGRAKEIIKMFEAAGAEAGTPGPEKYWFSSGKYDLMLIWKLENGPSDMEWSQTERSIKWRKAFIKSQGSEEKANEIQKEYSSLVSGSTSEICRKEL